MGLGMNIEIAVVLFYGCSDSDSHKECDCINRLDDVWKVENSWSSSCKTTNFNYVCKEVVFSLQENPHRSAGWCKKIASVGEDILHGSEDVM